MIYQPLHMSPMALKCGRIGHDMKRQEPEDTPYGRLAAGWHCARCGAFERDAILAAHTRAKAMDELIADDADLVAKPAD